MDEIYTGVQLPATLEVLTDEELAACTGGSGSPVPDDNHDDLG